MRHRTPRRARLALWVWCLSWLGVAFVLLMPLRSGLSGRADLLVHFVVFGGMAFGAVGFSRNSVQFVICSMVTILMSLLFELAQGYVPHRSADMLDGLANTLGAATGAAVALATWQTWTRSGSISCRAEKLWLHRQHASAGPRCFGALPSRPAAARPSPDLYRATKAAQRSARIAVIRRLHGAADPSPPA